MDGRLASLPVSPLAEFSKGPADDTKDFRFVGRAHSDCPLRAPDGAPLALQWVRLDHSKSSFGPDDNRVLPAVFELKGEANSKLAIKAAGMNFHVMFGGTTDNIAYHSREQIDRIIAERVSPSFRRLRYSTYRGSTLYVFSVANDAPVTVIGTFERPAAPTPVLRAKVVSLLMGDALDHEVHRIASISEGMGAVCLLICAGILLKAWSDYSKIRSGHGQVSEPSDPPVPQPKSPDIPPPRRPEKLQRPQKPSKRFICPQCHSRSVIRAPENLMSRSDVFRVRAMRRCTECGHEWEPPAPLWFLYVGITAGVLMLGFAALQILDQSDPTGIWIAGVGGSATIAAFYSRLPPRRGKSS